MNEWVPNIVFYIWKFMSHPGGWISHQDFYSSYSHQKKLVNIWDLRFSAAVLLRIQVFWDSILCCWGIASWHSFKMLGTQWHRITCQIWILKYLDGTLN